ncbi:ATP-dependent DNA ligase [Micromonospora sp. IBSANI012]|uniref:ATP-dependent DNA ligase n=1 Tax=Micromonospora sp. IBSANI012 TaxID=3457761 RepID=UPI0040588613
MDGLFAERRALLTSLLADAPTQLTLSPQSTDVGQATEWLHTWTAAGIEGLMIKRLDSRYEPGKRGWQKYRAYHTTEANFVVFTHMIIRAAAPTSPAPFAASTLVRQLMATAVLRRPAPGPGSPAISASTPPHGHQTMIRLRATGAVSVALHSACAADFWPRHVKLW